MSRFGEQFLRFLRGVREGLAGRSEITCDPSLDDLSCVEEDAMRKEPVPVSMEDPDVGISVEFIDLSATRAKTRSLLRAARYLFGDLAYTVKTPHDSDFPSRVMDESGNLIAFCWIDPEDGKPEFKPWCSHCTN